MLFRTLIRRGTHPTSIAASSQLNIVVLDLSLRTSNSGLHAYGIHPRLDVFAGLPLRPNGLRARFHWRDLLPGIAIWRYQGHLHACVCALGCGAWFQLSWTVPFRPTQPLTAGPFFKDTP